MAEAHPDPGGRPAAAQEGHAQEVERGAARSAAGLRLHAGEPEVPDGADGAHGPGGGRLHGHRHAGLGAVEQAQAAAHLFQAELRAGDEPADQLDPRRAGDEPGVVHRPAAEPARPGRHRQAEAAGGVPADPQQRGPGARPPDRAGEGQPVLVHHHRHHLSRREGRGRHDRGGRRRVRRGRGSRALQGLQHHHPVGPRDRPRPDSDSLAARHIGRASSPDPAGVAHQGGPGRRDRRGARGASVRGAGRLRRGGDQPLPRLRDAGADHPRARREADAQGSPEALHEGHRQGAAEGDVQDGHLHLSVLLRRADLRRRGPALLVREEVLHRHPYAGGRRRAAPDRARDGGAASPGLRRRAGPGARARCGRRVRLPHPRRSPHVAAERGGRPAARGACQPAGQVSLVRPAGERSVRAAHDAARPVPAEERRRDAPQACSSGGGRAGGQHRQALLDRCDELRLDLARGAHHARHRHEPHRRQVQHRRGRRGSRPLQDPCPTAIRCARPSSRWRRDASA